jgi:hypothetical protein
MGIPNPNPNIQASRQRTFCLVDIEAKSSLTRSPRVSDRLATRRPHQANLLRRAIEILEPPVGNCVRGQQGKEASFEGENQVPLLLKPLGPLATLLLAEQTVDVFIVYIDPIGTP